MSKKQVLQCTKAEISIAKLNKDECGYDGFVGLEIHFSDGMVFNRSKVWVETYDDIHKLLKRMSTDIAQYYKYGLIPKDEK